MTREGFEFIFPVECSSTVLVNYISSQRFHLIVGFHAWHPVVRFGKLEKINLMVRFGPLISYLFTEITSELLG